MTIESTMLKALRAKFKPMTFQGIYIDADKGESVIALDFNLSTTLSIFCKGGLLQGFHISGDDHLPDRLSEIANYCSDYLYKLGQEALDKQINYIKRKRS